MNKNLEIQICNATDADKISEVAIKAYSDFYLYLWKDDGSWYVNRSFLPKKIKQEIVDPNARFYLLNFAHEAIGFMKVNLDQPLEELGIGNAMELERIYIMKTFERKGIGSEAIEFCVKLAREMKKEILWLKSMDSSPAMDFYQRLGFEVCGSSTLDFEMMKPQFRGMKILVKKLK